LKLKIIYPFLTGEMLLFIFDSLFLSILINSIYKKEFFLKSNFFFTILFSVDTLFILILYPLGIISAYKKVYKY
jgi:hypothetical protein